MGRHGIRALGGDKDTRPKLILEAADCAQNGGSPSELLQMALDCSQYTALPRPGGISGQEAGLLHKLRQLANVFNSYDSMLNTTLNQQKWSETYPQMWAIVASVERLKVRMKDV